MDSTVCSCPKCNCKDEPEIIVKGEVILAICPKCKAVRSKHHGYKIDPYDPKISLEEF